MSYETTTLPTTPDGADAPSPDETHRARAIALLRELGVTGLTLDDQGLAVLAVGSETTLCLQAFDDWPLLKCAVVVARLPAHAREQAMRAVLELNLSCVAADTSGTLSLAAATGDVLWNAFVPTQAEEDNGCRRDLRAAELGLLLDAVLDTALAWRSHLAEVFGRLATGGADPMSLDSRA
jgi:NAD-dependent oxidoreductase involved in siderophore biosynthesis